jgi:hypothetical protein
VKDGDVSDAPRFPQMAELRTGVRRRLTRYLRPSPVVVLEYHAWEGYLLHALCPHATPIALTPGERANRLIKAIPAAARVVAMHVDLSVTDGFLTHEEEFLAGLRARGITILNHRVTDIRKRTMHQVCRAHGLPSAGTGRSGPPDEMVIIKTDLNCGGRPERWILAEFGDPAAPFAHGISDELHDSTDYRVCRRRDVPESVWSDPSVVVERFIENPDGVYFRVSVVGRATMVSEAWSDDRIKKLTGENRMQLSHFYWFDKGAHVPLGTPSEAATRALVTARELGAAMGADFHGTDCVMDASGVIVPVDINKTPWWGGVAKPGAAEHLRRGLDDLVRTARD